MPLGPTTRLAPEIAKSVVSPASDQVIGVLSPPVADSVVTTVPGGAWQATLGLAGEKVMAIGAVIVITSAPRTVIEAALSAAVTSAACASAGKTVTSSSVRASCFTLSPLHP